MLVSIIVTCYNNNDHISTSIDSVLSQSYKNIECIVVDDGSTDDSENTIKKYVVKDSRVKYFYKENGGAASARNYGINKASGNWLQALDGDDWIHPHKIERQLSAVGNKYVDNTLIYSDYEIVYDNNKRESKNKQKVNVGQLSREQILERIISRRFGVDNWIPITMNSILLSSNILKIHQYDENMANTEDLDFYYRILQDDINCIYVPMISMSYRKHGDSLSHDKVASINGYTAYLYTIFETNKEDLEIFPNFYKLLRRSILSSQKESYDILKFVFLNSKIPININNNRLIRRYMYKKLISLEIFKFIVLLDKKLQRIYKYIKKINYNINESAKL